LASTVDDLGPDLTSAATASTTARKAHSPVWTPSEWASNPDPVWDWATCVHYATGAAM
jgi:hypothetical protein